MQQVVLLIGSGGREHALAWKLAQSPLVSRILVAPGNPGCAAVDKVTIASLNITDHKAIIALCQTENVQLVIVGPEDPLAKGLANDLKNAGIRCFGPTKEAAQIESSKCFSKNFMTRHGIPTAKWASFEDAAAAKKYIHSSPDSALVVKASGLTAGKGVIIATSAEEACKAVDSILNENLFGSAGEKIIIEQLLCGEELSVLAFTDGTSVSVMPPSQDHKQLLDGDKGPNTGGMGAYCPYSEIDDNTLEFIHKNIILKTIHGMKEENNLFVGILYVGIMLTVDGPKVLEFNCRFGDPETQVILPMLESDLYIMMEACVEGNLKSIVPRWKSKQYAVGVVMASKGYPTSSDKGQRILGLDEVQSSSRTLVFHAGTAEMEDAIVTAGGRVLCVVGISETVETAVEVALKGVNLIKFPGSQYRTDIGQRSVKRYKNNLVEMSYAKAGVNIEAGNRLVEHIKPLAQMTNRKGVIGSLGGFGGLFDLKSLGYNDPILVSGTDGVGTKIEIAQVLNQHNTIGIDLVAMCVNDILAQGAEPLFFLDYYACGKLDVDAAKRVIDGIAFGCKEAQCALLGGETAEMPGLYKEKQYEIAGFAVGAVERLHMLPQMEQISQNDLMIGLSSSGIHSNGLSLVRKLLENHPTLTFHSPAPYNDEITLGSEFLEPTKIYVKSVLPLLEHHLVKGIAHITGGGLTENIPRILPPNLGAELDSDFWQIPPVFGWLQAEGNIAEKEMLRTFNCGIGLVLIVAAEVVPKVLQLLCETEQIAWEIGHLRLITEGEERVRVKNLNRSLKRSLPAAVVDLKNFIVFPKKIAVLISGSGTNLQALIDCTHSVNSPARIVLVISNEPDAFGLKRAENLNIPTKVICHRAFKSRLSFDMAVDQALQDANIDIVCLAGFMRILTGDFVRRWHGKMINIHPSLLPSFKGANAHKLVLESGVRISGCTVHFVVEEVDAGGIILQESVPVELDDHEKSLQERVKRAEHLLYPKALQLVAAGKVSLNADNKVIWEK